MKDFVKEKIVIVSMATPNTAGGAQKYVNDLELALQDLYEIETWDIRKNFEGWGYAFEPTNSKIINKIPKYEWNRRSVIKEIEKAIKSSEVKCIIMNSQIGNKKIYNSDKVIYVQHSSVQKYLYEVNSVSKADKMKEYFDFIFLKANHPKTHFITHAKNLVFYDESSNTHNYKGNSYFVKLPTDKFNSKINRGKPVWLSRLSKEKGVDNLININKLYSGEIDVYGGGPEEKKVVNAFGERSHGMIPRDDVNDVFNKASVYLHTISVNAGFEYVVLEALSNSTPVVMFDIFDSHKFYSKCDAVFVVPYGDINGFVEKINYIENLPEEEYNKISKSAYEFAVKNFSFDTFKNSWRKILKDFQ